MTTTVITCLMPHPGWLPLTTPGNQCGCVYSVDGHVP
jgi:hypothetical protein